MHKEITIYKIYKEIEEKRQRLIAQLESLNTEKNKLREQCPHSLVIKLFAYDKHDFETEYIMCPVCQKVKKISFNKLNVSINNFDDSKVIDLSDLKPVSNKDYYNIMQDVGKIIMNNPEYYYSDLSCEELKESVLKEIDFYSSQRLGIQRKREI